MACRDFKHWQQLSRRRALSAGALGLGGLSLATMLRADERRSITPRCRSVIFLHQHGGPSHIDTFDLKPDAPDGIRGEFQAIDSAVPGVPVCEHLPQWAKVLDRCAQVRSVHHTMKNHNSAGYYCLTGHAPPTDDQRLRDSLELYPAYGSVASLFRPTEVPGVPSFVAYPHVCSDGSVTPGQHASFLGKGLDPFFFGADPNSRSFRLPELELPSDVDSARLNQRRHLLDVIDRQQRLAEWSAEASGLDRFQQRAFDILASPTLKRAFDLSQEPDSLRDAYGRTTYGQSCLLARRLVETGVRFVNVYFARSIGGAGSEGWDTHQDNFTDLKKRLLPATDQSVPTLLRDLEDRGLLAETLVVWMGEFGRGPKIGDRDGKGRSHWPNCYTVVFAGGGTRGGAVYGASDRQGAFPAENPVRLEDIAATLFWALGIDPEAEIYDTLRRPLAAAAGRPLTAIFG